MCFAPVSRRHFLSAACVVVDRLPDRVLPAEEVLAPPALLRHNGEEMIDLGGLVRRPRLPAVARMTDRTPPRRGLPRPQRVVQVRGRRHRGVAGTGLQPGAEFADQRFHLRQALLQRRILSQELLVRFAGRSIVGHTSLIGRPPGRRQRVERLPESERVHSTCPAESQ
jgi:hypothetical protein